MRRSKVSRFILLVAFFALGLAVVANTWFLIEQTNDTDAKNLALHDIYEISARLDTARLEALLASLPAVSQTDNLAPVQRTYAAFRNTLETWYFSPALDFGAETSVLRERLADAKAKAAETGRLIDALDDPGSVQKALVAVQEIGISLNQVRQMAENRSAAIWENSKTDLAVRQNMQSVLMTALLATALLWIFRLYRRVDIVEREKVRAGFQAATAAIKPRHDPATGLMTADALKEKIRELQGTLEDGQELYVLKLEIIVPWTGNGAAKGDVRESIFAAVADRIQNHISFNLKSGFSARDAGNGFLIAMVSEAGSGISPAEFASRLRGQLHRPVVVKTGMFPVTAIAGIAPVARDEPDLSVPLQNADLAVAEEIRSNRRHIGLYNPALRTVAERQTAIGQALLIALEQEECLPHFQPQFDLNTGKIIGVEALARWYHPSLGWIAPAEIIPIAERTGLIIALEQKILETACAEIQMLPGSIDLAVNLSVAHMLNDDVPLMVADCLDRTGFPADRLKLEISAGSLPRSLDQVRSTLDALRGLGITLSLDNFGTPAAALSGVLQYRWDEVKIDTGLTGMTGDGDIGRDLMGLAMTAVRALGARPLIEGIETIDQRDIVTALGCPAGQGYLYGGPMAIDDLRALFFSGQNNLVQLMFSGTGS
jgi:EAL domain-containing protein (putative c-di-GMP-specific phosphodiesterase class I)/GGDEF domain-containing protein